MERQTNIPLYIHSLSASVLGSDAVWHSPGRRSHAATVVEQRSGHAGALECREEGSSWNLASDLIRSSDVSRDSKRAFLMAQTYPDSDCLTAPMQKILHKCEMKPHFVLGITHMRNRAGVGALSLAQQFGLSTEDGCLVLLNECLPFSHQSHCPDSGLERKPASCLLELSSQESGLQVMQFGYVRGPQCWDRARETVKEANPRRVFVPTSRAQETEWDESLHLREDYSQVDFLSSDVWISVLDWLKRNEFETGENYAVLTGDGKGVAYCLLKLISSPRIHFKEDKS